ncbi:MAG: hypothetical protein ABI386_01000 [Rhodanobacter sp.]
MAFCGSLIIGALLLAGAVAAQTTASKQSAPDDRWETPAAASSSSHQGVRGLPGTAASSDGPFQFKQSNRRGPADEPPPQANDKATVMGKQRPWQDGRPPVDCATNPRDAACH